MKKEIKFSLVYRDMWQSSGKYQPRADQLARIAPVIVEMGCFARVETNGGAFEQVNLLYGENPNKAVSIDIRKINIDKTLSELEVFAEFYSFQQKSNEIIRNFKKSILVDEQYYLLPFISGVLCCPDKHGDYLVFEYEDELRGGEPKF